MPEPTSPFIPGTKIQFAWDSSSLSTALDCPQRYEYEILEGWTPKAPDYAVALAFGLLLHHGIEQYHQARAIGLDYNVAVISALRSVLEHTERGLQTIMVLPVDEEVRQLAQDVADDEDADDMDLRNSKLRTRYHLFRALVWYFEHYRQDALKVVTLQSGRAAVEHSFRVPVGQTLSDGTDLLLAGHLDKLVEFNGELYVSDVKTTKSITRSYRESFDLSHQMTGYTLGGKIALHKPVKGVWIDAVQLQIGGVKFSRFTTYRSQSQLDEYIRTLKYVADQAEMWHEQGWYPLNPGFHCNLCKYRGVCRQSPEFRKGYLSTYFKREPAWNPLRNR